MSSAGPIWPHVLHKMTIGSAVFFTVLLSTASISGRIRVINTPDHSAIHTPDRDLLNNILHVPQANKSLISASRLTVDNDTFVEIHPYSFLVKEWGTKKVLLRGRGRRGLYPVRHTGSDAKKHMLSVTKLSSDRWHRRLGHPSPLIVSKIISKNNLPCANSFNKDYVCGACQKGKSHQLPYPK